MMPTALKIIEILGTIAFALSGLIEARKKGMDLVGIYFVALTTAFGGGTLRDIILGHHPIFWIEHTEYPVIVLVLCLISYFGRGAILNDKRMLWSVVIFDALGLGLFCASGISISLSMGISSFNSILMGMITGAFGGVLRDIICNEIPVVFRRTELYVTCVLIGCLGYLTVVATSGEPIWAIGTCIILTFVSRILSHKYQWRLPL